MQEPMIHCDVADLENVQAGLQSVSALLDMIIGRADSSAALTKDVIVSEAFTDISTALLGVFTLVNSIIEHATETITKAFQDAKKGESNAEEEADRA